MRTAARCAASVANHVARSTAARGLPVLGSPVAGSWVRSRNCAVLPARRGMAIGATSPVASVAAAQKVSPDPAVEGLEPAKLWAYFSKLASIPRPSKQEQQVLAWLKEFAQERGLQWKEDSVGNIVIMRPGSGGGEGAPPVVIQGHVDMVCEANASTVHDFSRDPIRLVRDGDWLRARGTTLGADNGIGVAAALALLDEAPTTPLPPLECLFTVDEETGLTGAFGLGEDMLQGRTMLNLDTEDWGELFVGCAGGGDSKLYVDVGLEPLPQGVALHKLTVNGLLGGHSGLNIHEGRGNAVQLMARTVRSVLQSVPGTRLASLSGGDKRNAIPREASAVVAVPQGSEDKVAEVVSARLAEYQDEYGTLETSLAVSLAPATQAEALAAAGKGGSGASVISAPDAARVLTLLTALPHGPLKFSHQVPGLVETSNNVASIKPVPAQESQQQQGGSQTYMIVTSTRSNLTPALEAVRDNIQGLSELAGARMERGKAYPGWAPRMDSPVLEVVKSAYQELTGEPVHKVGAIHAGLECGLIGGKFPGMDAISFGPTIRGAHSPDEAVLVTTVPPFYQLTLRVLAKLAAVKQG